MWGCSQSFRNTEVMSTSPPHCNPTTLTEQSLYFSSFLKKIIHILFIHYLLDYFQSILTPYLKVCFRTLATLSDKNSCGETLNIF